MNVAQGLVTGRHRLDDDAEGDDVLDLIEGNVLRLHLPVHAVEVLHPAGDARFEALGVHAGLENRDHVLHVFVALFAA